MEVLEYQLNYNIGEWKVADLKKWNFFSDSFNLKKPAKVYANGFV